MSAGASEGADHAQHTWQAWGDDVDCWQWYDAYSGMSGSFPSIRDVPYWIALEDGTIVGIEEQYLP